MKTLLTLSAVAVLIAGCSSGSSYQAPVVEVLPPPPVAAKVSFSNFVADAFGQDADAEPVIVNDDQLLFDVDDDPAAFNALIEATE